MCVCVRERERQGEKEGEEEKKRTKGEKEGVSLCKGANYQHLITTSFVNETQERMEIGFATSRFFKANVLIRSFMILFHICS